MLERVKALSVFHVPPNRYSPGSDHLRSKESCPCRKATDMVASPTLIAPWRMFPRFFLLLISCFPCVAARAAPLCAEFSHVTIKVSRAVQESWRYGHPPRWSQGEDNHCSIKNCHCVLYGPQNGAKAPARAQRSLRTRPKRVHSGDRNGGDVNTLRDTPHLCMKAP